MKKKRVIADLKWLQKMEAYRIAHCNRVLQAENLTEIERTEWESKRIWHIGRESVISNIIDEIKIGAIK